MREINWLKKGVIYSIDVRSFKDGNHDGKGDFNGLLSKVDYLTQLGIRCIWMAPFYSSNQQDDGYDVTDYYRIDPQLGTMEEFRLLVEKAKANGIKIVLDLVVNHTSGAHPWFKTATGTPGSLYHDYYIWKAEKPPHDKEDLVFKTIEESNWEYEPSISAYFYHTFYKHQPDLNMTNPRVQTEVLNIIDFWMGKGIDGFRIDAVPHILRDKGDSRFSGDPYGLLGNWRRAVLEYNEHAILIGEADVEPENYPDFVQKDRLTALFNFYLNNYTFLALATQCADPLFGALKRLPLKDRRPYLNFLRNHDELDLERLTEKERKQVYAQFAPEPSMIIYDRGIRRRLAPMVDNDHRRIKLAMSLLFTLPGTPVLRYGEEIGMGDDLNLPERKSVRTVMQWSDQQNGGFSDVVPQALKAPLIREGKFSYKRVNVAIQAARPESLLNDIQTMIYIRNKENDLFAHGEFMLLNTDCDTVLAYAYYLKNEWLVAVHHFAEKTVETTLGLPIHGNAAPISLIGTARSAFSNGRLIVELGAYAYSWLIIRQTP